MTDPLHENKKTALVLGSGAARGLAHIGVLKVLEQLRIPVDIVVGSSLGAMIGGAYAAGLGAAQLEEIACETNWLRVAQILFPKKLQSKGLLDGGRVQDFLLALLGERKIEELNKTFACVATDIITGEEILMHSGSLVKAIRASISFPFLFTPIEIDGRFLVDGGVVNPLPVSVARELGADIVIAVGVTPAVNRSTQKVDSGSILTAGKIKAAVNANSFFQRLAGYFNGKEMPLIHKRKPQTKPPGMRQQMVQIGTTMENMILSLRLKENPPDVLIRPQLDEFQFFDFNRAGEIIAAGEQASLHSLDKPKQLAL